MKNTNEKTYFDYIILGAGPAGLQMGYFLEKSKKNYLIIEADNSPGSFFKKFPRHRKLISINKRYTGCNDSETKLKMDWNSLISDDPEMLFTRYSEKYFPDADDFVNYLMNFSNKFKLNIKYNTRITHISKENDFILKDDRQHEFFCKKLIVATGVSKPFKPDFKGKELIDWYDAVSVNPHDYINQRVLIIGKGNSAFETADNLIESAAVIHIAGKSSIKMAWQTHYVGHLRAVNNNFLDTYQLKSQNAILDGNIISIKKENNHFKVTFQFSRANDIQKELIYDRVIGCTGFRFDNHIFDTNCAIEMVINNRFPKQNSHWESANVPNLYFAGTLMQVKDFKKSTSGFVHGFRYAIRSLHRILNKKYHDIDFQKQVFSENNEALSTFVTHRVTQSSALWQQFESLGDMIAFQNKQFVFVEELPPEYIHELASHEHIEQYFIVTLEYGNDHLSDPFDITFSRTAQNDPGTAHEARYLHPVVRYYVRGKQCAEHHIAENLDNQWNDVIAHQKPLTDFFKTSLSLC